MEGCETVYAPGTLFAGAGGALAVYAIDVPSRISVSFVDFNNNSHTGFGGVFYIYKKTDQSAYVSFSSCQFKGNAARWCSLGLTVRSDGWYKEWPSLFGSTRMVEVWGRQLTMSVG